MGSATRTKRQSPQPIRIVPYFVTANISFGVLDMLRADNGTLAYTLDYFQRTLSVVPFQQNLFVPDSFDMCGPHVSFPDNHKESSGIGVPNADYIYYITAVEDGQC